MTGVVVDDRANLQHIADGEEARRLRTQQQRQRGDDVGAGLADERIAVAALLLKRQVVRLSGSGISTTRLPIGVGSDVGCPIGGVAEIFTHIVAFFAFGDAAQGRFGIAPSPPPPPSPPPSSGISISSPSPEMIRPEPT